ncbi:PP2C family protein-serine/threonine phosphatase [Sphingomonas segetis]|jgi:serine/threonine protein phosphatase PrpC|uniref:PP2C family protein-serine/threonine phosphatase n=1 Tax=Sphingomonas segetis TaxID=1104779 RepID=UPI0012D330FB|nr:protein phosphatase 2C domain-containing protein [Sphingomonas segetis]
MNTVNLRPFTGVSTHQGQVRDHNEDGWFASEEQGLWAVADGMGGHENGEWASGVVVEALGKLRLDREFEDCCDQIAEALHEANEAIQKESSANGKQMGTTAVVLFVRGSRFAVLWVGDSRAYLLRDGALHQLSKDHTQVQEMVDLGMLEADQAHLHPMRHVLARAIGVTAEIQVDAILDEIEAGDTFLLASDGLHCCVGDDVIARMLAGASLDAVTNDLVNESLDQGAPDNVTVVAVRFREATVPAMAGGGQ